MEYYTIPNTNNEYRVSQKGQVRSYKGDKLEGRLLKVDKHNKVLINGRKRRVQNLMVEASLEPNAFIYM